MFTLFSRLIENAVTTLLDGIEKRNMACARVMLSGELNAICKEYFFSHQTLEKIGTGRIMLDERGQLDDDGFEQLNIVEDGNIFSYWFDEKKDYMCISGSNLFLVRSLLKKMAKQAQDVGKMYTIVSSEYNKIKKKLLPITFDHIFLPDKSTVKERLDKWLTSRDYYARHFLPYKCCFLFRGSPGTGKTSIAKAIANYLSYNFIEFRCSPGNDYKFVENNIMSYPKTVFLFDEIDRLIEEYNSTSITDGKTTYSNRGTTFSNFLLRLLESQDITEVVIIFTTNKDISYFDPALFRAGRIDHIETFNKCSRKQFESIYKMYVENDDVPQNFPEYKFSPAEVIHNICIPYRDDRDKIIELLG